MNNVQYLIELDRAAHHYAPNEGMTQTDFQYQALRQKDFKAGADWHAQRPDPEKEKMRNLLQQLKTAFYGSNPIDDIAKIVDQL